MYVCLCVCSQQLAGRSVPKCCERTSFPAFFSAWSESYFEILSSAFTSAHLFHSVNDTQRRSAIHAFASSYHFISLNFFYDGCKLSNRVFLLFLHVLLSKSMLAFSCP